MAWRNWLIALRGVFFGLPHDDDDDDGECRQPMRASEQICLGEGISAYPSSDNNIYVHVAHVWRI